MNTFQLGATRVAFKRTLKVACTVFRMGDDPNGGTTLQAVWHHETWCGFALFSNEGRMLNESFLRTMTAETPGNRTLSFGWDEDILTQDIVVIAHGLSPLVAPSSAQGPLLYVGLVNAEDPQRFGIQVECDLQRSP